MAAMCLLLAAALPFRAQKDALTLPRNLAELVSESDVIVQGYVTSARLVPHAELAHLMTVVVTLRVEDALKGHPGEVYTMRQALLDPRDREQKFGYRPGQHLLLILMKPNAYGLSSPAGLEQGRFRIEVGPDGKLRAANRFGNAGLFRGLSAQLQKKGVRVPTEAQAMLAKREAGPVPLEPLKSLIRVLAVEK